MAKRLKDWPSRLDRLMHEARSRLFAWGQHDCCLWGADAVLVCTGVDPAAEYRGRYRTALGAARLVKRLGGMEAIGALGGGLAVRPAFAGPGDVGLLDHDDRAVLAVYSGQEWLCVGTAGLVTSASRVRVVWKVGHA